MNKNSKKTIVYLVRHGAVELDDSGKALLKDSPLNSAGIKQAENVANQFHKSKEKVDFIFTSEKNRAVQTANIIGKKLSVEVTRFVEFNEQNMLYFRFNLYLFLKNYIEYRKSIRTFNRLIKNNSEKVLLFVTHGNVMRGFIGNKLGISFRSRFKFNFNHASITRLIFREGNFSTLNYSNSPNLFN